jgi:hypothetical protein
MLGTPVSRCSLIDVKPHCAGTALAGRVRNFLEGLMVRIGSACKFLTVIVAGWLSLQAPALAEVSRPLTRDAAQVYDWVVRTRDNHALPFMIIDKRQTHLWVYDAAGRLKGNAPVLLGSAKGDHTAEGIGSLQLSQIRAEDRTTPAGRFVAEVGRNERGENVVWVDYDSGVSMHPVLTTNAKERREQRLATPAVDDNRVSFGCINVPKAFHANIVLGTVRNGRSVVYVLPETRPVTTVFTALAASGTPGVARQ